MSFAKFVCYLPNTSCQFHQHYTCAFFVQKYRSVYGTKVLCATFLLLHFGFGKRISAKKALLYEKRACKMLMKLTTGVKKIYSSHFRKQTLIKSTPKANFAFFL